jgi:hypothetical protein
MMKRKFFDGRAIFGASMSFGIFFNTNKQGADPTRAAASTVCLGLPVRIHRGTVNLRHTNRGPNRGARDFSRRILIL